MIRNRIESNDHHEINIDNSVDAKLETLGNAVLELSETTANEIHRLQGELDTANAQLNALTQSFNAYQKATNTKMIFMGTMLCITIFLAAFLLFL